MAIILLSQAFVAQGTLLVLTSGVLDLRVLGIRRTPRAVRAGMIYHVPNRGNARMRLFHKDADLDAFKHVSADALERQPVDLPTYCLVGNHGHLVVRRRRMGQSHRNPPGAAAYAAKPQSFPEATT